MKLLNRKNNETTEPQIREEKWNLFKARVRKYADIVAVVVGVAFISVVTAGMIGSVVGSFAPIFMVPGLIAGGILGMRLCSWMFGETIKKHQDSVNTEIDEIKRTITYLEDKSIETVPLNPSMQAVH